MDNGQKLLELRQKAEQLFSEKNWERLLLVSSEIIKLTPNDDKAYVYRGVAKINLGYYKGAINDYTKAIKINPDNNDAYVNRGIANAKSNYFQDAINDYDNALKINPKNDNAYVARGFVQITLGNIQDAINDCNKALEINPKNDDAYINRGSAKMKLDDIQGAINDYDKALEIKKDAQAYVNRGIAKGILGNHSGAIEDFDKALEINSSHIQAIHNRGVAHALIKSQEEQEKTIKKLDEQYKTQIDDHKKQIAASQKEKEEAIDKIKEAYKQQLSDHDEQLLHAHHYNELVKSYKTEFDSLSRQKGQAMEEIKTMVKHSLICLATYLFILVSISIYSIFNVSMFNNVAILPFFLPALTMASLYLFPQIWSMRNIERDRSRYWALREDAYTKWILTLSAHRLSTKDLPISEEFREKLFLKLFEHHNDSNTPNIILSKHGESGKSDNINNIVRNFASPKDEG